MIQTDLTGEILIIDDQPLNIKLLTVILMREGFAVETALSGEESFTLLENYLPDLILLDILLPGMNGVEVCQKIKQNPKTADIPIMILSVVDSFEEKVNALRAGAVDYISKPFSVEEVITRVRIHLSLRRLQRELAQKNAQLEQEIGKRENAERELKRTLADLKKLTAAQTEELQITQKQLIRQEKLAALGKLAGNIGHELRNPLGAIKNAAYFLTMALESIDPEVQEALDIMNREVNKSTAIIDTLLSFARAKTSKKQPLSINKTLADAVADAEIPDDVEVVWQLATAVPKVSADREQLNLIFQNLINNGIEAMPKGGQLHIGTAVSDHSIHITIKDTGMGIPPENMKQLFEPLFTTKANGIGLGLALVKSLVDAHQGEITVESQLGTGSVFRVKLPVAAEG